jgi:alpha-1,6-mannosyltransferase
VTPRVVRWTGFAGGVLVGASAYLGGSSFTRVPLLTVPQLLSGDRGPLLPVCWIAGLALLLYAWWAGRRVVPSTRWAVITAALWFLPVLPMLPLGSEDIYSYACQGWVQHAGGDPYAAGVQVFGCPWLGSVSTTWRSSPAPYGPLFLLLAGWAVAVGRNLEGVIAVLRVIALAGLAVAAAGLPVLARRAGIDPAKAVWTVLACPLVLIHLVSGAHNDAVMIGLLVAALAVVAAPPSPAVQPSPAMPPSPAVPANPATPPDLAARPNLAALVAAGALLGLAGSVKATALVVLPFAVLAAVPSGSPVRALWRPGALVAAGAAGAMAAVSLLTGRGFGWVTGLTHSGDTVEWTSPSTAVGLTVEYLTGRHVLGATRAIGLVVLVVALIWLWWRARTRDAIVGAGLALAATVLCAPVFHPWYATWPLAVLAAALGTRIRWVLIPCAVASTMVLPSGHNWALATRLPGSLLMTAALVVAAGYWGRRSSLAKPHSSDTLS